MLVSAATIVTAYDRACVTKILGDRRRRVTIKRLHCWHITMSLQALVSHFLNLVLSREIVVGF